MFNFKLRLLSWLLPDAYRFVTLQIRLDAIDDAIDTLTEQKADLYR